MKKNFKKLSAILMAIVMVLAMSTSVFAATGEKAASDTVTVSVVQNSFNPDGIYSGKYDSFVDLNGTKIINLEVPISEIQSRIDMGYKYLYLPSTMTDPMNNQPTVIDAIITALDMKGITDIDAAWDTYYNNGAYIKNINSDPRVSNTVVEDHKDANGKVWYKSYGHGWNIAYSNAIGSDMIVPQVYASTIPVVSGMNIIIDISYFEMIWS